MKAKGNTGNASQDGHNVKSGKKTNLFGKAAHCFLKYLEILGQLEPE
jgi:hypothetical protein